MSQTSHDRDNSRRVRTHEKNSGETVRRLGTIIQSILCSVRSRHPLQFMEIAPSESVPRGSFVRTWKLSSRLFSRPDWLPMGLRGWARGNVHFQQHAWRYFAFKRLVWCSDDRSLPLVEKICDSIGFRAANRLRVKTRSGPQAVALCCLYFVLWREWQRSGAHAEVKQ